MHKKETILDCRDTAQGALVESPAWKSAVLPQRLDPALQHLELLRDDTMKVHLLCERPRCKQGGGTHMSPRDTIFHQK